MVKDKSLVLLFLFSPALCFFRTLSDIRRGDYLAAKMVPFIMGLFAYLFPPYSDFARNLYLVCEYQNSPLSFLWAATADTVVPTIEYFFIKFGIPIEIFRFLYTFFIYKLFTNIFLDIRSRFQLNRTESFKVWVFLFMMISFFAYIINLRTLFVNYTLLYCIYKYYVQNLDRYRYYALLLCFVHFAYIPIILIFFISKYFSFTIPSKIKYIFIILILFSSIFSDSDFLLNILSSINFGEVINNKIEIYTVGEWSSKGDATSAMTTTNYIIYKSLAALGTYYIYYLFVKLNSNYRFNRYINMLFVLIMFTAPIGSLFSRYIAFFNTVLRLYVLYAYTQKRVNNKQMNIYLCLCLLETALNVYAHWNCLVNGNVIYLLLPLPIALFQVYNFEEWCNHHLTADFNKFKNLSIFSR